MNEIREDVRNESVEKVNDIVDFIQEHPYTVIFGCIGLWIGIRLDGRLKGGK